MSKRAYAIFGAAALSLGSEAALGLPPDADRVNLRVSGGCAGLPNCVESMDEVNDWLANVRAASPPPVLIDIGAGTFGPFVCSGGPSVTPRSSNITLRGAGRSVTKIVDVPRPGESHALLLSNCDRIELQHLTVEASHTAIRWGGPGTSTYTDIEASGGDYAWWETDILVNLQTLVCPWVSEHWSWSSTWRDSSPLPSNYVWAITCSRNFFYDSEILGYGLAVSSGFDGEMRLYGSVVRVRLEAPFGGGTIYGVFSPGGVVPGAKFHMHGGIFAVDASAAAGNVDVIGVTLVPDSVFHTQETAFLLKAGGTGTAIRIQDQGGVAESPLLLAPTASPPNAGPGGGAYVSTDGQDLYVETDCLPSGDCDSTGNPAAVETHLMAYSSGCSTAGPWFDTVTGRCRGLLLP